MRRDLYGNPWWLTPAACLALVVITAAVWSWFIWYCEMAAR